MTQTEELSRELKSALQLGTVPHSRTMLRHLLRLSERLDNLADDVENARQAGPGAALTLDKEGIE